MFRKIVSNLNFSPALVGQLGFYAKRLRKEEATRRLGLIFTALALVVQSFAVFTPPEAANAASSADFVRGGVKNKQEYLKYYDRNYNNIKDIYTSLGITRAELAGTSQTKIREAGHYNWAVTSIYSYAQGQRAWSFKKSSGAKGVAYYRPMSLTPKSGPVHTVFQGYSKKFGWFAFKKECGNLVTKVPPKVPNPQAVCQGLTVRPLSSSKFRVSSKASQKDGASIKGYSYEVRKAGKVVTTRNFASKQLTHSFDYVQASPGTYSVRVVVNTTVGKKTAPACQDSFVVATTPTAVCAGVNATISNRTIVSLEGSARVAGGATVSKYTFVVKNATGQEVKRVVVNSNQLQVTAESFELTTPANYSVELTVTTSVGAKTNTTTCRDAFVIVKKEVCAYNPSLPPNSPDCQPCPENPDVWVKDEDCNAEVINTKTATNMSQGNVNATTVMARASDKISYTLTIENKGIVSENVTMKESLEDVLEYTKLIDMGGGTFNADSKVLTWPVMKLAGGQKQSRTIVVEVLNKIPATNTGISNEASYDCRVVNTFGNAVEVDMDCPTEKVVVEQVVKELPQTGPRENMIFAGVLLAVVVYFYARSKQLGKEVRLVRRSFNAGTI